MSDSFPLNCYKRYWGDSLNPSSRPAWLRHRTVSCLRRTSLPQSTRIQLKQVSRSLYATRTVTDHTARLSQEKTVLIAYYVNLKTRRLSETDKEKATGEPASLTEAKGLRIKKQSDTCRPQRALNAEASDGHSGGLRDRGGGVGEGAWKVFGNGN